MFFFSLTMYFCNKNKNTKTTQHVLQADFELFSCGSNTKGLPNQHPGLGVMTISGSSYPPLLLHVMPLAEFFLSTLIDFMHITLPFLCLCVSDSLPYRLNCSPLGYSSTWETILACGCFHSFSSCQGWIMEFNRKEKSSQNSLKKTFTRIC